MLGSEWSPDLAQHTEESHMWQVKTFKTRESMTRFLDKNAHRIQWHEIFVNNAYGIQYRKLRRVY